MSSVIATAGWAARWSLLILALGFIGLSVGVSCVLLPQGVPIGLVALAGLVLLWVLPDLRSVPYRLARRMYFPFIVSTLSLPIYIALIFPGMPWISLRRTLLFLLVGVVFITIAGSSECRASIINTCRKSPALFVCSVGYYLTVLFSVFISINPTSSINDAILQTTAWWMPGLATVLLLTTLKDIRRFFLITTFCVFFDFVIGAVEFYLKHSFLIYILPPSMRAQLVSQNALYEGLLTGGGSRNGLYRAVSVFTVGLSWGEMAAMMAPIAAHFLAHGSSRLTRVFGGAGILACFLSVVLSGSRGGYVGFIAAMIIYFLLWALRSNKTSPQRMTGGITLVIYSMFSAAVLGAVFFVPRVHTFVLGGSDAAASNDGRSLEWALALPKLYDRPIFGYGVGTAAQVVGFFNAAGLPTLDSYAINVLIDTGVLGLALFSGALLAAIAGSLRTYLTHRCAASAMLGALGSSLIAYTLYRLTLSQTENNTLAFVLVGVVFAANKHLLPDQPASQPAAPISKPTWRAAGSLPAQRRGTDQRRLFP